MKPQPRRDFIRYHRKKAKRWQSVAIIRNWHLDAINER